MNDCATEFENCAFCHAPARLRALSASVLACGDCGSLLVSPEYGSAPRPTLISDAVRDIAPQGILNRKYHLQGKLGQGAQGETYLARHLFLNYLCTIKVFHQRSPGIGPTQATNEARLGLMVRHPNVVQVLDCDEEAGRSYIVLEYVDGMSVAELLTAKSSLPWIQVTQFLDSALAGLGAIHDAGIIHRDIRPENLLVDTQQRLRIADLGVATIASHADAAELGKHVADGTVTYVAPELMQVAGKLTATVDFYSLGATAFEMLAGAPPFAEAGIFSRLLQSERAELEWPGEVREATPAWLRDLIARMMSADAESRPQSVDEIRLEVAQRLERSVSAFRLTKPANIPKGTGILPFTCEKAAVGHEWVAESAAEAIRQALQQFSGGFVVGAQEVAARLQTTSSTSGAISDVALRNAARGLGIARLISGAFDVESSDLTVRISIRNLEDRTGVSQAFQGRVADFGVLQQQLVRWVLTNVETATGELPDVNSPRTPLRQQQFAESKRRFDAGEYTAAAEIAAALVDVAAPDPESLGLLGVIRSRLGEYAVAESCYARQIERAAEINEPHWILEAQANLGVLHYYRGEFERARTDYERAVAQAEKLGRTADHAQILNNLGFVYVKIGMLEQAEQAFRRAIEIHLSNGAMLALIGPYNGLGNALVERGALDEAEEYFRKALAIAQEMRDQPNMGMTYVHLGSLHQRQGLRNLAQQDYALAMSALEGTAFSSGFAKLYDAMADLNMELKQPDEAIRCIDRRIELARQQRNRRAEADAWLQRSRAQHLAGDVAGIEESLRHAEALGEQSG